MTTPPEIPPAEDGLWVKTVPNPDSIGYRIGIACGARTWTLTPDEATAYALAALARCAEAEHDSAVMRLLVDKGLEADVVGQVIARDLRPERVVDNTGTAPLEFRPGVSLDAYKPFLHIYLDGEFTGQIDPDALRDHALSVLEAHRVADLDAALERWLASGENPPERQRVRNMIGALSEYRDARETPREKLARIEGRAESLRAAVHEVDDDEAAALLNERCQQWEAEARLMRGEV